MPELFSAGGVARLQNYAGGWLPARAPDEVPVENPATREILARVPLSRGDDVNHATTVAQDAASTWRLVPAQERVRFLFAFRARLADRAEALARTITREQGKTLDESRDCVRRCLAALEQACSTPRLLVGEVEPELCAGVSLERRRQPVGVIATIAASAYPALSALWSWPVAIAAGNTVIVKPSLSTPMSQQLLFEVAHEAGLPAGVLNLVHGDAETARLLVAHPEVDAISFVGSSAVARQIYAEAARHAKRVHALGGVANRILVLPDADLDRAAQAASESAFGCAGQRCFASQVVIAVGECHDRLLERLARAARRVAVGNGLESGISMGPMASAQALEAVGSAVDDAVKRGAKVVVDGREVARSLGGLYFGPTLLTDLAPTTKLWNEGPFGPVLGVASVPDVEAAMRLCGRGRPALSVFSASARLARQVRDSAHPLVFGVNIALSAQLVPAFGGGVALGSHAGDLVRFCTVTQTTLGRWS